MAWQRADRHQDRVGRSGWHPRPRQGPQRAPASAPRSPCRYPAIASRLVRNAAYPRLGLGAEAEAGVNAGSHARDAASYWEMRRPSSPESAAKEWNLRRFARAGLEPRSGSLQAIRERARAWTARLKIVVSPVRVRVSPLANPHSCGITASRTSSARRSTGTRLDTWAPVYFELETGRPVLISGRGLVETKRPGFPSSSESPGAHRDRRSTWASRPSSATRSTGA